MKNLKDFLITESQKWSAQEVYDFVDDIINGDHGDIDGADEYYDEKSDELDEWLKNNKSKKFICKTSSPDYWGFSSSECEEVDDDYIDEIDGPEDNCGLYIGDSDIMGHVVPNGYMNMDYFDFAFEEE